MKFVEKHEAFATIFGLVMILWSLSITVMTVALCFTGSILLLKCITSLAIFMAFAILGLFYAILIGAV